MDPKFWFPAGPVNAILATNGAVYLGGDFAYVGPHTGPGALFNQSTGGLQASPPPIRGTFKAVVPDGSGGWFVGGTFTAIGGVPITNIAHLNGDLTLDTTWNAEMVGSSVNALALEGGQLYIGGSFSRINGLSLIGGLAAVPAANPVVDWNPMLSGTVYAMQAVNDLIYVGGSFYSVGASNLQNLAVISTNTALATAFTPSTVDQPVLALCVTSNNIYVGGQFSTIGTKSKNHLAALDINTGVATSWNPNPNGIVRAIVVTSSNAFVGGDFTTISVANRRGFASLALTGAGAAQPLDLALGSAGTANFVRSLVLQSNSLYVGGQFTNALAASHFIVVGIDITSGLTIPTPLGTDFNGGPGASFGANALAVAGGNVMVAGDFQSLGGVARLRAAALSMTTGAALPWAPMFDAPVLSLAMGSNCVYVGGNFLTYNTTNDSPSISPGLAAVDPLSGDPLPFTFPGTNTFESVSIAALAVSSNTVYAGGNFTAVGGQPRRFLAALDGTTGNLIPDFNANLGGGFTGVTALQLAGTNLYVGGDFSTVNAVAIPRLTAVSPVTGVNIAWAPTPNQTVNEISASADTLYIGGLFTSINLNATGAITLNHFAAFSLADNSLVPVDAALNSFDSVSGLAATETAIYLAGSFAAAGGSFVQNLGDLSSVDATPFAWNPSPDVGPTAITLTGSYAFFGGTFRSYGQGITNQINGFFAAFDRTPQLVIHNSSTAGNFRIDMTTGDTTQAILQVTPSLRNPVWSTLQTYGTGFSQSYDMPITPSSQFFRLLAQ
ncbi:MAG TPA: hypothetical protein VGO67_20615 [Verrucomicrobiae bacterium]